MRLALAGIVAATAVVLGAGEAPSPVAAQTLPEKGVSVFGRRFTPQTTVVTQGQTVRFRNLDRVDHTVTSVTTRNANGQVTPPTLNGTLARRADGDTGPCVDPTTGQSNGTCSEYAVTFNTPGRYPYICTIHKRMAGTIQVNAPERNTPPSPQPTRPPSGNPGEIPPRAVSILGRAFSPRQIKVKQGGTITFVNGSLDPHTATIAMPEGGAQPPIGFVLLNFDTGVIPARPTVKADATQFASRTFDVPANTMPGRYPYICLIHPRMAGTIIVEAVDPNQ